MPRWLALAFAGGVTLASWILGFRPGPGADGPPPSGLRYCINPARLEFERAGE